VPTRPQQACALWQVPAPASSVREIGLAWRLAPQIGAAQARRQRRTPPADALALVLALPLPPADALALPLPLPPADALVLVLGEARVRRDGRQPVPRSLQSQRRSVATRLARP